MERGWHQLGGNAVSPGNRPKRKWIESPYLKKNNKIMMPLWSSWIMCILFFSFINLCSTLSVIIFTIHQSDRHLKELVGVISYLKWLFSSNFCCFRVFIIIYRIIIESWYLDRQVGSEMKSVYGGVSDSLIFTKMFFSPNH